MQSTKIQHSFVCAFAFFATLLLTFPLTTSAQTVNIPDANLHAAIAVTLGKTPGSRITKDEMAALKRFEAHDADISDLTGLEFATALEEIRCNNNLISDLSPLERLIKLNVVELRHNVIEDLSPIDGLINLGWLIVPDNLISDLSPIKDLINMRGLAIENNVISDLSPLAGMIRLERIWMSGNPLGDLLPLSGLISLRTYQSWGTPILNLSALVGLPKLQVIDICGGELSDLSPLEGFTTLKELYLADNEISDISPLASLTGLTRLSLNRNRISNLSPLASLRSLTWIELEDNRIVDFSPLDVFPNTVTINKRNNPGFTSAARKIDGPWLWVIVPTGGGSGSQAAASGKDFLEQISGGTVTELKIARQGAVEGDAVGDKVWTLGEISRKGGNNINELVNTIGLGTGNIDYHVAYGSVNLESSRAQNTKMFVGSGDAVKVWLNGELIHDNPMDRDAEGYQENFPVTLKQGTNVFLIAVYEGAGWWSGFFGLDAGTEYTVWTQSPIIAVGPSRVTDVNGDGIVSILDLILVARDFERTKVLDLRTDVNGDGKVNILDLTIVARSMDKTIAAAPSALILNNRISSVVVRTWISRAYTENDGSLAFQQGIANLERLLAALIPPEIQLFANYPNPFNPETWIPYQLAKPSDVTLYIYAASGVLVRRLEVGYQPAGHYQDRNRAAYWDGKNEMGESVASGVYFYTFTAGSFMSTRKMLIMK